jgi:hypothetical protein
VTQYIKVAVIGAKLKELVLPPVPLVQHIFDQILASAQPKANWPVRRLSARIAFHL